MHARILGCAIVALPFVLSLHVGAARAQVPARCDANGVSIQERFISADCADCWSTSPSGTVAGDSWLFDWIVPSARGSEAPLSPAALAEAGDRLRRIGSAALADDANLTRRWQVNRRLAPALRVVSSPAWKGYFALQFEARGTLRVPASGWLALVEAVPVGTDGTRIARELVRAVVGPINLDDLRRGRPVSALHALRWPETAKPERLHGRAWIEDRRGALLAVADESCNKP